MAYLPPHKRHSNASTKPTTTPAPPPSLRSLSLSSSSSSPRGSRHHHHQRGGATAGRYPRPSSKIIHASGCVSRWSPLPPFPDEVADDDDDDASPPLRLEPFPCDPIERKTGAKPLALVSSSSTAATTTAEDSAEAAASAIAGRFVPDLLAAAGRAKAGDVAKEEEEKVKLSVVAKVGKVLFQSGGPGGSPLSMNSLRDAVKAGEEGSRSQIHKSFYTNVRGECLNDMERVAVEKMELKFDSSKEHYHVKVFDKHQSDSTITCKCTVQEDGKLAIHKVESNQVRHLVEDISCLFKDLDLRLMLSTKRILKNLDAEVENAVNCLVSSAVIDPDVKGGLRWPLGKEWIDERFSIVGVWHTNYKAFRNENVRLKLRHADRFDHQSSTGEVSNEVAFILIGISEKLEADDQDSNLLKDMLESAVRMIWEDAMNYKMAP